MLGASAPVGGVGEVKLQYALYDQKAIDSKAHQITLGYVHNLSKRTALYGNLAFLKNKDLSTLGLQAKGVYAGGLSGRVRPGGLSRPWELSRLRSEERRVGKEGRSRW